MASEQFSNGPQTTLNGSITSGATSLVVASATGFPSSPQFRIRIDNELLLVTAIAGTTWTVTRAIESTTAAAHSNGATLTAVLTAGALGGSSDAAAGTPSLRSLGTGATQACAGNDSRLSGHVFVQKQRTDSGTSATGTTTVPFDNTIPQNTEGTQFMTVSITPNASSNLLHIRAQGFFSPSVAAWEIMALFQDSTANALAAVAQYTTTGTGGSPLMIDWWMTAGTTSSTTFKIRAGMNTAGTTTFNGNGGNQLFGGVMNSFIEVTEWTP
jgi:hypothetical protein